MRSGVGFSEILLILALLFIFVEPKHIPELLRKSMKIAGQLRAEVRRILNDISKE
jgi:Sec-independent protein translocase protein TatA